MDIPRERPKKRRLVPLAIVAGVLLLATLGLSQLKPAAPTLDAATLYTDVVRRGTMLRQVRGPGTLVPENVRIVSAMTAGRVERVLVRPGAKVEPGTLLIELSNPDVQLEGLDAERQLKVAEADLANLRSSLESQRLAAVSTVASVRSELREAERQVKVAERLAQEGLGSAMEIERARDDVEQARARYESEQARLAVLTESLTAQLALRRSEVERLQAIARFQSERVGSMKVRAGAAGVVQSLALEPGQWVNPGQPLARIAGQERLKAVIRIPENEARDVALGLKAVIDTRNGTVEGRVSRVDPGSEHGTVGVDIAFEGPLPKGARPDLSVDGLIEIERLDDVLHVGRPVEGSSESTARLFRVASDGRSAQRTPVQLGRGSYQSIEVVAGLEEGDRVILSDMSQWDRADRVILK